MNIFGEVTGQNSEGIAGWVIGKLVEMTRRLVFCVIRVGAIPEHMAFIMDGNRRFARKWKLEEGVGHKAGFLALMTMIKYCYELGVKYVTLYAFSIDNFKRGSDEVQNLMDLMQEKLEGLLKQESITNQYGVRIIFIGDLKLLYEPIRIAAEKAMKATEHNTNIVVLICVAYSSTYEICHAVDESCKEKCDKYKIEVSSEQNHDIKVSDLEKHMYMAVAPDPDILVRSSGETRLSNFLLLQTTSCLLYSPKALWPELGFWHVVWGVLKFQRSYSYLEKKKKQS